MATRNDTSAGSLLNYRGQAENAVGSSIGGESGLTTMWGDTDASRINERIDWVSLQSLNKNKILWDAKREDQKKVKELLASEQMQLGRMLPGDREYITKNIRDKAKQMLLDDPDFASDPKKYQQFQDYVDQFKEAKTYAGVRLLEISNLNKEIGDELDPEKKARLEQHRNKIQSQGLYDEVKPFQQVLDWSPEDFAAPKPIVSETESIGKDGNSIITTTTSFTPLKEFTDQTRFNYIDSPNQSVKNRMDEFANSFRSLPVQQQDDQLKAWNEKIVRANENEGLKPGDTYYVPPIVRNPNTGQVEATTIELHRAAAIAKNYRNATSDQGKISALPSNIAKNKAEIKKTIAETELKLPAEVAKIWADIAKTKADAAKTKEETKGLANKNAEPEELGNYYIQDVVSTFNPDTYNGLGKLENGQITIDNRGQKYTIPAPISGINGTVVTFNNGTNAISGLSDSQLSAMGIRETGSKDADDVIKSGTRIVKPELVIFNNDNTKNPFFVARYPTLDPKTGQKQVRTISAKEYLTAAIKGVVGENTAGKEAEVYTATMRQWRKRTGSENVNGTIQGQIEKSRTEANATQSLIDLKRKIFKPK